MTEPFDKFGGRVTVLQHDRHRPAPLIKNRSFALALFGKHFAGVSIFIQSNNDVELRISDSDFVIH